jgi:hypothetical protein
VFHAITGELVESITSFSNDHGKFVIIDNLQITRNPGTDTSTLLINHKSNLFFTMYDDGHRMHALLVTDEEGAHGNDEGSSYNSAMDMSDDGGGNTTTPSPSGQEDEQEVEEDNNDGLIHMLGPDDNYQENVTTLFARTIGSGTDVYFPEIIDKTHDVQLAYDRSNNTAIILDNFNLTFYFVDMATGTQHINAVSSTNPDDFSYAADLFLVNNGHIITCAHSSGYEVPELCVRVYTYL